MVFYKVVLFIFRNHIRLKTTRTKRTGQHVRNVLVNTYETYWSTSTKRTTINNK
jgi:hypothetical protein